MKEMIGSMKEKIMYGVLLLVIILSIILFTFGGLSPGHMFMIVIFSPMILMMVCVLFVLFMDIPVNYLFVSSIIGIIILLSFAMLFGIMWNILNVSVV